MNRYYLSNPRSETEGVVLKKLLALLLIAVLALPSLATAASSQISTRQSSIGDEEIEPKDPMMAMVFTILPGLVFHGSGNLYAGDYEAGTRMLVMEIFGGALALWGHNMIHQPGNWGPYFGDSQPQAGYWVKAAGVGLIAVSWIWDVATAAEAAESWNRENQLHFQMDTYGGTGGRVSLAAHF
jgi:hypothetical protein